MPQKLPFGRQLIVVKKCNANWFVFHNIWVSKAAVVEHLLGSCDYLGFTIDFVHQLRRILGVGVRLDLARHDLAVNLKSFGSYGPTLYKCKMSV